MNIDKFKQTHADILRRIDQLRRLSHAGVAHNAEAIAKGIVDMSSVIRLQLAAEDQSLYPALARHEDAQLVRMGERFQSEMGPLAASFTAFAKRWNTAASVRSNEADFRAAANDVLRRVFERVKQEDNVFYPRVEASGR